MYIRIMTNNLFCTIVADPYSIPNCINWQKEIDNDEVINCSLIKQDIYLKYVTIFFQIIDFFSYLLKKKISDVLFLYLKLFNCYYF